jgi:hypothetical protein
VGDSVGVCGGVVAWQTFGRRLNFQDQVSVFLRIKLDHKRGLRAYF